jgi:hypothetical protein
VTLAVFLAGVSPSGDQLCCFDAGFVHARFAASIAMAGSRSDFLNYGSSMHCVSKLAGVMGFEPTKTGVTGRCLHQADSTPKLLCGCHQSMAPRVSFFLLLAFLWRQQTNPAKAAAFRFIEIREPKRLPGASLFIYDPCLFRFRRFIFAPCAFLFYSQLHKFSAYHNSSNFLARLKESKE